MAVELSAALFHTPSTQVKPRSHRTPEMHTRAFRHRMLAQEEDVDVRLRTGIGDAVIFDNRLLHRGCRKSQANLQHIARLDANGNADPARAPGGVAAATPAREEADGTSQNLLQPTGHRMMVSLTFGARDAFSEAFDRGFAMRGEIHTRNVSAAPTLRTCAAERARRPHGDLDIWSSCVFSAVRRDLRARPLTGVPAGPTWRQQQQAWGRPRRAAAAAASSAAAAAAAAVAAQDDAQGGSQRARHRGAHQYSAAHDGRASPSPSSSTTMARRHRQQHPHHHPPWRSIAMATATTGAMDAALEARLFPMQAAARERMLHAAMDDEAAQGNATDV